MSDSDAQATSRELRLQTYCLLFFALIAAGLTLWLLRPVLVPFVLALFFTIGLSPLLDLIQRRLKATRPAAIGVTFILAGLLTVAFGTLLVQSISVIEQAMTSENKAVEDTVSWFSGWLRWAGVDVPKESREAMVKFGELVAAQARSMAVWMGGAMLDLLVSLGVVLVFMFFLLAGASSEVRPTTGLWAEIEGKIRSYIVTKTVISVFTGLAFGLVLALFRIPLSLALMLGVLAFLLNYVPNVGPVIAAALPLPIVMFMMPTTNLWVKVLAVVAGIAVQVISGNVIEPKIMGDSFQLHPIVILLSLILWGIIWGPVGVLLAVPMTAAVKVLLDKLEQTRPVAELLAGNLAPLEEAINREAQA